MTAEFVTKNKPSGKEYLDASLECVIDRANRSGYESEIPFVSAVLSAKANRDQKRAANQTFFTAVVSALVAALSLVSSVLIYRAQSHEEEALKSQLASLAAKYDALREKLHAAEIVQARQAEQLGVLVQSQATTTELLQAALRVETEHAHSKMTAKPPAKDLSKSK